MVPRGQERIRVVVHAANTEQDIDNFVAGIAEWAEAESHATVVKSIPEAPNVAIQSRL